VAEWLRNGLQNRVPRFNSGRGLQTNQNLVRAPMMASQKLPPDCHPRDPVSFSLCPHPRERGFNDLGCPVVAVAE
jgi:hypothetical protein